MRNDEFKAIANRQSAIRNPHGHSRLAIPTISRYIAGSLQLTGSKNTLRSGPVRTPYLHTVAILKHGGDE
jgi:hypothetical protein